MKIIFLLALSLFSCNKIHTNAESISAPALNTGDTKESSRIRSLATEAEKFCKEHKFNNKIFFLVDMSLHSGKKRFFVFDMKGDSILCKGLVAHGTCGNDFLENAKFSNEKGCGCSSVGKYKIGGKYNGRFGTAYKLYGLDSSNSNASARTIVLLSYYTVPDKETYPNPIGNSLGCPMVSASFLKQLEGCIDKSAAPILLWIVN